MKSPIVIDSESCARLCLMFSHFYYSYQGSQLVDLLGPVEYRTLKILLLRIEEVSAAPHQYTRHLGSCGCCAPRAGLQWSSLVIKKFQEQHERKAEDTHR
jgi:hypothetical protein